MYGKLVDGKLIIAPKSLTNSKGGTITNPKEKDYLDNGWLKISFNDKEDIDTGNYKLEPLYIQVDNQINVNWQIVALTQEEKRQMLVNKVYNLEIKYNMCRWERELILAENSQASDYTKNKAQEIENLAKELR